MSLPFLVSIYRLRIMLLGFRIPPTAMVIWRQNLSLKSHPGSVARPLGMQVDPRTTPKPDTCFREDLFMKIVL